MGAPKPVFLDSEKRTEHLDVHRVEITSWPEQIATMKALGKAKQANECEYETIVTDTLDALEKMMYKYLCKKHGVDSIAEIGGGWGIGYGQVEQEWIKFNQLVEGLRDLGFTIIHIAHSHVRLYKNPEGEDYDRHMMKLRQETAHFLVAEMDYVGFACFEDMANKEKKFSKAKGVTTGERILKFAHSAAYDSKDGKGVDDELPLDWNAFTESINKHKEEKCQDE